MKAKYDDIEIELTDRYMKALHELTAAFLEMMRKQDSEHKKCWAWGRCEVKDLASVKSLEFDYGGDEDKPDGMKTETIVVSNHKCKKLYPI